MAIDSRSRRVLVIGGGLAGLAAAHRLRELATLRELPLEATVLERGERIGGALDTVRRGGLIMETGADSFLTEKPWAADLAKRLGLERELLPTREEFRRTLVVRAGRLVEIPEGFSLMAPARLLPILRSELFSPLARLRIMLEPLIPRRKDSRDESLAAFVTRRLGREVLERVAQPLAGGIYTADPSRLSIRATMPRFVEMERRFGSLYLGLRAAERARAETSRGTSGARWSLFLSLRSGMATLADALASRLAGSVRVRTGVEKIERSSDRWLATLSDGSTLDADAVICAAPALATSQLVAPLLPKLAALLAEIDYSSAATVNFAYREADFPRRPDCVGFVVPIVERRKIIAGSFTSLKFENRAPNGMIVLRAFLGGVLQSNMMEVGDDQLIAAAREEFRALLGVTAEPREALVRRWPSSMPQYQVGHLDRVDEIERAAAGLPHFALAGAAYRGVGIPDVIRGAELAAESIFEHLA